MRSHRIVHVASLALIVALFSVVVGIDGFAPLPTAQAAPVTFTKIETGELHSCGITNSGGVLCWGRNNEGQLGDGSTSNRLTPVAVVGLSGAVSQLSVGAYHTCAVDSVGLKCWGRNNEGQLGDGSTSNRLTPLAVSGLSGSVTQLRAGDFHTCAVDSVGAKCWGRNNEGQLGDGSTSRRLTPVAVVGLSGAVSQLSAGGFHTCAVDSVGAKCWGRNSEGQLGDGSTSRRLTPVAVVGLSGAVSQLSVGAYHTCAVDSVGAKCWGYGNEGELGNGTANYVNSTPVAVSDLSGAVSQLSAGGFHTCAVDSVGAKCWGYNINGQLGDGSTSNRLTPVAVVGLSGAVSQLSQGGYHTCALDSVGAKCWGRNSEGQLGDGTTSQRLTPVAVLLPEAPVFTSGAPAAGTVGVAYGHTFAASGPPAPSFALLDGSLPPGLSLNATSGALSGMPSQAGSFVFTIRASNSAGSADQPVTLEIAQGSQTITFIQPNDRTYGDPAFNPGATASSYLPVSYSSATPGVCLITGTNEVELIGVGTCEVKATQEGDTNYLAASPVTRTFAVGKASQTITFNQPLDRIYGDDPFNPGATASSSLSVSYTTTTPDVCVSNGISVTIVGAGLCTVQAEQLGNDNYTAATSVLRSFTVQKAVVLVTPEEQTRRVGSPNPNPFPVLYTGLAYGQETATSGISGAPDCSTDATPASDPGPYAITCTTGTLNAANYSFTFATGTLIVKAKLIPVVSLSSPGDITYGTPLDITQLQATASFDNLPLDGQWSYLPENGAQLSVGNGQILKALFTPTDSVNYESTSAQVQINVLKANLYVTANPQTRVYGSANLALSYSATGFVFGENQSVLTGELATTATANSPVDDYTITQGTLDAANYAITFTPSVLTVTKAALTVNADAQTRLYGAANPALTFTATGFVLNENATVLTGALATTATPSSPVDSYPITQGTLDAANYAITFTPGTLIITKAPLTVNAIAQTRTYGADNPPLTYSAIGFVNNENEAVLRGQLATAATPSSPVGPYPITQGTLDADNYAITFDGSTLTVTKALLTVTAKDAIRKVNTPNPTFTALYGGFVNDETLASSGITGSPVCTTTAVTASLVGPYPITCTAGTLAASNYNFAFVDGTLTVTAKDIPLITWPTPADITYGLPLGPTELNARASFNNNSLDGTFVYTPDQGSRLAAGNGYVLEATFTPVDTATYAVVTEQVQLTVRKAPLTVAADTHTRTYGATNPALTYTLSGFVAGEDASLVSGTPEVSTTATKASPVGSYPITVGKGSLGADNYRFELIDSELTIVPSTLVVRADDQQMVEGSPLPTLTATFSGFVNDETLATSGIVGSATCSTAASSSSAAGTYVITCTGGTLQSSNYRFSFVAGTLTVTPLQFVTITSITIDTNRKPIVVGKATANSSILAEIDTIGAGTQIQANTVAYVVQSDATGDWSLTTATATPQSGSIPTDGFELGTQLRISAQLLDATNAPVADASTSVIQLVGFRIYIPVIRYTP